MKLYMAHVGFYDSEIGMYELHSNLFVVAEDMRQAKQKIKERDIFIQKNMHIDGIKEINNVDGFEIQVIAPTNRLDSNKVVSYNEVKKLV